MKPIFKFLIAALILCALFGIASAETDNFSINISTLNSYTGSVSFSGGGGAINQLGMNLSLLSNPPVTILQATAVSPTSQSGTFTGTIAGNTIVTGTYSIYSGATYGAGNEQINLFYSTYTPMGYTGIQTVTLNANPAFPNDGITVGNTNNYATNPVTLEVSGFPKVGNYITNDNITASNSFSVNTITGNIVNMNVNKPTGTSLVSVFSNSGSTLIYNESGSANSNAITNQALVGSYLIFQSNFFGKYPVNSTIYFGGNYVLSLLPSSGLTTQTYSEIFTDINGNNINNLPSLSSYQLTQVLYSNGLSIFQPVYSTVTNQRINYQKYGSNWYQFSNGSYSINVGSSLPTTDYFNVTYGIPSGILPTGKYLAFYGFNYVTGNVTGSVGASITLTNATIPVGPQQPINVVDSSNGNLISNATIGLIDQSNTGAGWANVTAPSGSYIFTGYGPSQTNPLTLGDNYLVQASASGYSTNSINYTFLYAGLIQTVSLSPNTLNPITGQFAIQTNVIDSILNQPISPATVTVSNSTYSKTATTNSRGIAFFQNLTAGQSYQLSVSSVGYITQSQYITGTSGQIVQVTVTLVAGSPVTTAPTFTVTTTSAIQTNVPITPVNGNYTGFWGNTESLLASMNATSTELGILMAVLLIFIGLIVGASSAGMLGAEVGASAGFIAACAFGFISFYWIVALLFLLAFVSIMFRNPH